MNQQDHNADAQEIEISGVPSEDWAIKGLTPPQLQAMPVTPMNEGVTPPRLQQMTPPPSSSSAPAPTPASEPSAPASPPESQSQSEPGV